MYDSSTPQRPPHKKGGRKATCSISRLFFIPALVGVSAALDILDISAAYFTFLAMSRLRRTTLGTAFAVTITLLSVVAHTFLHVMLSLACVLVVHLVLVILRLTDFDCAG